MTTLRLVTVGPAEALALGLGPREPDEVTSIRLAYGRSCRARHIGPGAAPALLVAYPYLGAFTSERHRYALRNWALDSGAYSAANSGVVIDRDAYHATVKELLATDPTLVEVFALDVIGDWRASLANAEAAWAEGIPAIPTYHMGEPTDALVAMAKEFPKVALGGSVGARNRIAWAQQCMARVWPKPVHGLGFGSPDAVLAVPFHSVDASSWEQGPTAFGRWRRYGNLSVRGGRQNLRGEVDEFLAIEAKARMKWRREMAVLDQQLADAGWRGVEVVPT